MSDSRRDSGAMNTKTLRVLIPFNTVSLYGMERGVIETFDLLRPEVEPHFLLSLTTRRNELPVLAEIERRGLGFSYFSDRNSWSRIGRPRSLAQTWRMTIAMIRGNLDVLRASRGKDGLYLPGVSYFYFAILAAIVFRLSGKRIIYQFHDLISRRSLALRLTAFFVTDFVHNTETGRAAVVGANPYLKEKRNFVIPCPIDTGNDTNRDTDVSKLFEAKRNVLFVGQVSRHKGIDLLLDAFLVVSKSRSDVALHIIGGCDDASLKTKLEQNAYYGVKYWGYRDDIFAFLRKADLLVQTSPPSRFRESFGRTVVEAMSLGIPSVCFGSGSLSEIVTDEKTGLICEEETAQCLAKNISRLLDNNDLRSRLGSTACESYKKRFSTGEIRRSWLTALKGSE